MPRYAANLTIAFNEYPVLERFERAAELGFTHVEMLFPYQFDVDQVERELKRLNLTMTLFDTEPGDWGAGERGYLCDPARAERFQESIREAIDLAKRLGVPYLNALAGKMPAGVSFDEAKATAIEGLRRAAPLAEKAGVMLMSEGLNTIDNPGYFLSNSTLGFEIVDAVGSPNVTFQYDVYHMQIMEGNLISTIRKNIQKIGYVQIADPPARNEPGTGEINYQNVLAALDAAGFQSYVGLEYKPATTTEASMAWLPREARANR
jgi:hydroxypyruvate isomerase